MGTPAIRWTFVVAVVGLLPSTPGRAHAQRVLAQALPAVTQPTEPSAPAGAAARAGRLEEMAEQYELNDASKVRTAARLRMQAAELRNTIDRAGAIDVFRAANDRYYAGDRRTALALMQRAAEWAQSLGDVVQAARAYTDAAYIAIELRDRPRTRSLARRAVLLTYSPLITEEQRVALRSRLVRDPSVLAAATQEPNPE